VKGWWSGRSRRISRLDSRAASGTRASRSHARIHSTATRGCAFLAQARLRGRLRSSGQPTRNGGQDGPGLRHPQGRAPAPDTGDDLGGVRPPTGDRCDAVGATEELTQGGGVSWTASSMARGQPRATWSFQVHDLRPQLLAERNQRPGPPPRRRGRFGGAGCRDPLRQPGFDQIFGWTQRRVGPFSPTTRRLSASWWSSLRVQLR